MILIELTAAVDAAGTLTTFYVSEEPFVTEPTDTPPNTAFLQRISDAGSLGLHAFSDGRTGGATRLETGEIRLINIDGELDDWVKYSFDGRPVVIRSGADGAYPARFATVLVATVEGVDCMADEIVIRIKDKQFVLEKPILTALYGGTNALPNGVDGVDDLKGKARPRAFGKVLNISPPMVNTSRLIFEVGICNSVDAVYSNGAPLTLVAAADYTSKADMEANSPASGYYRAWPAGGYFRIGSYAAEQITADVTQGASLAQRTVGQVLVSLALAAGLTAGEISTADADAMDAINPAVVGIWIDDATTTTSNAMAQVAASVGAWSGFDTAGVLRMGILTAPAGTPKVILTEDDVLGQIERRTASDVAIPIFTATVNHTKNYTVQTSGLAGSAAARKGFVSLERRSASATDADIKKQWLMAGTLEVDTLLTTTAAGDAEAARVLALHKVRRDIFEIPVPLSVITDDALWMLETIGADYPRFDMDTGRLFRVIGIAFELSSDKAILTVWG